MPLTLEFLDDAVPVVEALSAAVAVGSPAREAPSTLLAPVARHSRDADAAAVVAVALARGRPGHVALTLCVRRK